MKGVFFIGESPLKSHAIHLLCSIKYEFFIHFGHKGTFLFLFFLFNSNKNYGLIIIWLVSWK